MRSTEPLKILLFASSGTQADTQMNALVDQGWNVQVRVAREPEALRQELAERTLDGMVCGSNPEESVQALTALQQLGLPLPCLALKGDPLLDSALLDNFLQNLPSRSAGGVSSAALLAAFDDNTSDGLLLVTSHGQITYANRSAEKMFGLKKDELEGTDIFQRWAESSAKAMDQALKSVWEDSQPVRNVDGFIRQRSGRAIPIVLNASPVKDRNQVSCAVLTLKNNSELRRASADITLLHKQMDVERSHFETIMQQFPAGILIAEAPSGRIVFFNAQAQSLLGDEAVSASCIDDYGTIQAYAPDGEVLQAFDWPLSRALATGLCVPGGVVRMYQKEAEADRYLSLNAAPIMNSEGQVTSAVMAIFDITTERKAQQTMIQAKEEAERANHAKTAFLANISHEIRTPLGAIIGFTGLLRSGDIPPQEQDETLAIIERNGQDLLRLIDEILDLSKVEAQKMDVHKVEASVAAIIRDVLSLLGHRAREKGLVLSVATQTTVPDIITTDPARLKQILVNIVGNAIKFTEKGSVTIEVCTEGELTPDSVPLAFRIRDSGIGISADQRSQLFQPFSQIDCTNTRRFGGTGLGLLLSRKLAKLLGGDVLLEESAPGIGSIFQVSINGAPARKRVSTTDHNPAGAQLPAGKMGLSRQHLGSLSILVVDDSTDNRLLLKSFLTRCGAQVEFASDGREAVEKAVASACDIVLMDLQMPVCDGYTATRRLRELGFDRPILALSAHARQEEQEKSLAVGCNDHITKPINMDSLLAAIVRHTGLDAGNQ